MFFLEGSEFLTFLAAVFIVNITPGADVMFVCSKSISGGKNQGFWASLGISAGLLIHVFCVTFGLSQIFSYSPMAFTCLKITGAFYLFYLAYQAFHSTDHVFQLQSTVVRSPLKTFRQGMITTLLNPKVAVFFLMFLPQFVDPSKNSVALQFFILGSIFVISGTFVNLSYAYFIGHFRRHLLENKKMSKILERLSGTIFGLLGLKLLYSENN